MSLTTTLSIAQQALSTNAALSTIVSRNIAGVNNANYSTKIGKVETTEGGGVRLAAVTNAADDALFAHLLGAKAGAASSSALSKGLDQLEQTLGLSTTTATDGTSTDTSPATLIATLQNALQQYANAPSSAALGAAAVTAAKGLAAILKASAAAVQDARETADQGIATAVATVNALLKQFGAANTAVVDATVAGKDATDAVDTRNGILQQLSAQLGITTADAGNGGLALYTDGGATLFQGTARTVAFSPTGAYTPGTVGGAVTVDGVAVTGAGATMPSTGGAIAGLAQLRDVAARAYGDQLDQIAAGLVTAFAGTDASGNSVAGLFMDGTSAAMPTASSTPGLAARLSIPAAVDPGAVTSAPGVTPKTYGSVTLLRDGNLNGGTTANTAGAASYSDHLNGLLAGLTTPKASAISAAGASGTTLAAYASSSVSWLEAARQSASTEATDRAAIVTQTTTSLSSATGVNLDEQLSKMLDLEHSYQASAELMTTVKAMLDALLQAVN